MSFSLIMFFVSDCKWLVTSLQSFRQHRELRFSSAPNHFNNSILVTRSPSKGGPLWDQNGPGAVSKLWLTLASHIKKCRALFPLMANQLLTDPTHGAPRIFMPLAKGSNEILKEANHLPWNHPGPMGADRSHDEW